MPARQGKAEQKNCLPLLVIFLEMGPYMVVFCRIHLAVALQNTLQPAPGFFRAGGSSGGESYGEWLPTLTTR